MSVTLVKKGDQYYAQERDGNKVTRVPVTPAQAVQIKMLLDRGR